MPSEQLPEHQAALKMARTFMAIGPYPSSKRASGDDIVSLAALAVSQDAALHAEREAHAATKTRHARLMELANAMAEEVQWRLNSGSMVSINAAKSSDAFRAEFPNTKGGE
jgi:hypothetical protein